MTWIGSDARFSLCFALRLHLSAKGRRCRISDSPSALSSALDPGPTRGLTVADVAARYRVSPDKVRGWIKRGELRAINTAAVQCGKPRFVIPPEALPEFERRRSAALPPKPARRRRPPEMHDFYPD
jgi:Helix-turn-helix domain